ncbi:MAG TPA: HAD family phosphatase [Candidatus Eisenbacteria bacterium]|nr:HAD family phosphatase [Candidatus Eisenbacteria bacterium]
MRSGSEIATAGDAPIAAVIFDLDGVLVDTQIWWRDVRDAWAAGHGISWRDEDERRTMGANTAQWARTMGERAGLTPEHDLEIAGSIVDALMERYRLVGAPAIPGAAEAARRIAASYPVAVASGSHRRLIDAALDAIGVVDVIRIVVSADDVPHGKPAPDVYLEAARRLGAQPGRCLVVEDSMRGLQAARAAGMRAALVPNAKVPPDAGAAELADLVLERLDQLDPATIRAMSPR